MTRGRVPVRVLTGRYCVAANNLDSGNSRYRQATLHPSGLDAGAGVGVVLRWSLRGLVRDAAVSTDRACEWLTDLLVRLALAGSHIRWMKSRT